MHAKIMSNNKYELFLIEISFLFFNWNIFLNRMNNNTTTNNNLSIIHRIAEPNPRA